MSEEKKIAIQIKKKKKEKNSINFKSYNKKRAILWRETRMVILMCFFFFNIVCGDKKMATTTGAPTMIAMTYNCT